MADEPLYIDDAPAGAEGWREVWQRDRRYRPSGNPVVRWLRRFAQRLLRDDAERQRNFNFVLLDLIADVRSDVATLRSDTETLRKELRSDIESLQRDMVAADAALAVDLTADVASVRPLIPIAARRNDALISALDQKIETIAVRLRDLTNPSVRSPQSRAAGERDGVEDSRFRSQESGAAIRESGAGRGEASRLTTMSDGSLYRRLEDSLRGSEAAVLAEVEPYVERARGHQPLIDAGCGRGELLAACRAAGIEARGFDTNERSVADLKARGFDVQLAAIPECFAEFADGSLGSVAVMHVVEHLPVEAFFALFREAARVLRRGGLLMIETPNAESMMVSASEFWRDPTHLAPRHPASLTTLGREHGFAIEEIVAVHPFPEAAMLPSAENDPEALKNLVRRLNDRLFAPQDLRLILRRE